MHSVEELGTNVPAFLAKLWKMVEDSGTNDLICWSPNGTSFYIRDQAKFARELLPLYYKHNNMASFVRQLNMYGFHKVVSIESGGLKIDRDDMEFAHQYFLMGYPFLVERIKRKIPTNKTDEGRGGPKPEHMGKILSEVKYLKGKQENVDSQLDEMKRTNQVLWREVAILRQKHLKQQQIVNKLIQFLVSMVQTSRGSGFGIKRHYPLMLNDTTHHTSRTSPKINDDISEVNSVPSNFSPTGPVIHELDPAELLDDCTPMVDETAVPVFDLCDTVDVPASTTSTSAGNLTTSAPDACTVFVDSNVATDETVANKCVLDGQEPDVLLEFVEDCPMNNQVTIPTENLRTLLKPVKPNKGKQKSSLLKGNKRRKSKLLSSMKTPVSLVTIKTERDDSMEPVNVNNFLEIMLPSLNDESNADEPQAPSVAVSSDEMVLPDFVESIETEARDKNEENALEAATDAAISAISNVAAQSAASERNTAVSPRDGASKNELTVEKLLTEQTGNNNNNDLTLACAGSGDLYKCKEDFDVHLDNMQSELDTLKELLKGEGYNLDANMLIGLFGEDSVPFSMPVVQSENSEKATKQNGVSDPMVSGSELMTYSSNLLDLTDISGFDDNWSLPAENFNEESNDLNTPIASISSPGFSGIPAKKKKISK